MGPSLAELGATSNINLLHPMQDSIKQQNTFTTIAAANVEVKAIAAVGVMNGYSIQTQVYRRVATTSSYSYWYSVQSLR